MKISRGAVKRINKEGVLAGAKEIGFTPSKVSKIKEYKFDKAETSVIRINKGE